jgi:hypothetical protein
MNDCNKEDTSLSLLLYSTSRINWLSEKFLTNRSIRDSVFIGSSPEGTSTRAIKSDWNPISSATSKKLETLGLFEGRREKRLGSSCSRVARKIATRVRRMERIRINL